MEEASLQSEKKGPSSSSSSCSLVELVAAFLPLVDHHSEVLMWHGSLAVVEFVEHLFPFVADLVQNGCFNPHLLPIDDVTGGDDAQSDRRASASDEMTKSAASSSVMSKLRQRQMADVVKLKLMLRDAKGDVGKSQRAKHEDAIARKIKRAKVLESSVSLSSVHFLRHFYPNYSLDVFRLRLDEDDLLYLYGVLNGTTAARKGVVKAKAAVSVEDNPLRDSKGGQSARPSMVTFPQLSPSSGTYSRSSLHSSTGNISRQDGDDTAKEEEEGPVVDHRQISILEKKESLLSEIIRIMKTPKGRRVDFADPHFPSFDELRAYVEVILSALFFAADVNEEQRLQWSDFETFLTDSSIVYSNQLAIRDVPIYVEASTTPISGIALFSGITSGSRLALVTQVGVQYPNLKLLPPNVVDERVRATTVCPSPTPNIKAVEFLEDRLCLICCSDRAIHFLDYRFGGNCNEFASFTLDSLLDSPCSLIWLSNHNVLIAGGISGYLWKITPPVWSAAKREWKPPRLAFCSAMQHVAAANSLTARSSSPNLSVPPPPSTEQLPVFHDVVSIIRRGFHPNLLLIATKALVHVYDMVAETIRISHSAAEFGIHHVSCLSYNCATQYAVCSGETLFLLVWLSPNLANQSPVHLEDLVTPHSGHLVGLESHPSSAMIISMDNHGMVKVWDLNAMMCTQNIFLPSMMKKSGGLSDAHLLVKAMLRISGQKLFVVNFDKVHTFKVDDETIQSPPSALIAYPTGGSYFFSANRDILQWSSNDGKKILHHQNVSDIDIINMCFAGPSAIAVLNSHGAVSFHSSSSGKVISQYTRKILLAEGVDIAYCPEFHRVVLATASLYVWFLSSASSSASQDDVPVKALLPEEDGAATCLCVGFSEKRAYYCVGTVENSICIFVFIPPQSVRLHRKVPSPSSMMTRSPTNFSTPTPLSRSQSIRETLHKSSSFARTTASNSPPRAVVNFTPTGPAAHGEGDSERRIRGISPPLSAPGDEIHNADDEVTVKAIIITMRAVVVSDSSGSLRVYRCGSWTLQVCVPLWEIVRLGCGASLKDSVLLSGADREEFLNEFPTGIDGAPLIPHVVCMQHYKKDSIIACGDTFGRILFFDIVKSLQLMTYWVAHTNNMPCSCIAIDREILVTSSTSVASIKFWTSEGDYLGSVWGDAEFVDDNHVTIPQDVPLPSWMAACDLIGESSIRLRKKLSMKGGSGNDDGALQSASSSSMRSLSALRALTSSIRLREFTLVGHREEHSLHNTARRDVDGVSFKVGASSRRGIRLDESLLAGSPHPAEGAHAMDTSIISSKDVSPISSSAAVSAAPGSDSLVRLPMGNDDFDVCSDDSDVTPRMVSRDNHLNSEGKNVPTQPVIQLNTSLPDEEVRPLPSVCWKAKDVTALDDKFREILGTQRVLHCVSQCLGQPDTIARAAMLKEREASLQQQPSHVKSPVAARNAVKKVNRKYDMSSVHKISLIGSGNVVDVTQRRSASAMF